MPPRDATRRDQPALIRRRVVAILQGMMARAAHKGRAHVPKRVDLEMAFGAAYTQAQDKGWIRPGTRTLTPAGRAEDARRAADPRAAYKDAIYAWLLVVSRVAPHDMARAASRRKATA